jgi:hypothetical protein
VAATGPACRSFNPSSMMFTGEEPLPSAVKVRTAIAPLPGTPAALGGRVMVIVPSPLSFANILDGCGGVLDPQRSDGGEIRGVVGLHRYGYLGASRSLHRGPKEADVHRTTIGSRGV